MLTLLRAACICLFSLQSAAAAGAYKNPITGGMGSGEISPPTPMKRRFDYAAADKSGLTQMGMDAGLSGQILTNFIASGGTARSTAQKVLSPSELSKKAEAGDANAQYNLGEMYYEGKGVPQHYVRAHMWFNLAAASGYLLAIRYRDMVAKLMTPQEIAKAQEMALNCQQRKFKGCD